ncbi:MAG: Re/Si-specific NAD(P)(+) transhydrogenase subunit alpha [Candidatus Omnitrophica bacterium]|nr:Re/Si-specific NAD(P)(+) transhydrogenase subunit alpha [Candidatus Omnitrophota bacterium]
MIIIPKVTNSTESRVALVPESVKKLVQSGFAVRIQTGAGEAAGYPDDMYKDEGAEIAASANLFNSAKVVLLVQPPDDELLSRIPTGCLLISFLNPLAQPELAKKIADKQIDSLAFELVPRITRAQNIDALSSQSNIGGYKAVLMAANHLPKFFPMLTTAAGTVIPAKVLVIGVGVAGLQAIATAKRLGAVVEAYDIRPEVKEQVESLGAKFVEIKEGSVTSDVGGYAKEVDEATKLKLQQALEERVASSDAVITTALVPGKKAPVLVTAKMVASMKPGSVIVDMAAGQGGNVEGSKPDETVDVQGVKIYGPTNLPSTVAKDASRLYSKNIENLLKLILKDGSVSLNFDDEVVKGSCLTHQGKIMNERVANALGAGK